MYPCGSQGLCSNGLVLPRWDTTDTTAGIWNADTGERLRTLRGHTSWVFVASFSPDGTKIREFGTPKPVHCRKLSWVIQTGSPDGTKIVTASIDKTAGVWNADTGARLHTLEGHTLGLETALFSPDGSTDTTAGVWDAVTDERLFKWPRSLTTVDL